MRSLAFIIGESPNIICDFIHQSLENDRQRCIRSSVLYFLAPYCMGDTFSSSSIYLTIQTPINLIRSVTKVRLGCKLNGKIYLFKKKIDSNSMDFFS